LGLTIEKLHVIWSARHVRHVDPSVGDGSVSRETAIWSAAWACAIEVTNIRHSKVSIKKGHSTGKGTSWNLILVGAASFG
jgi:hypothetical protein